MRNERVSLSRKAEANVPLWASSFYSLFGINPPTEELIVFPELLSLRAVTICPDESAVFASTIDFNRGAGLASRYAPVTSVEIASNFDIGSDSSAKIVYFLVLALKIVLNSSIQCPIASSSSFNTILAAKEKTVKYVPFEDFPEMVSISSASTVEGSDLEWIQKHLTGMIKMASGSRISNRFILATELLFVWSYTKSHRMALMTLWSAIDAIFGKNERDIKRRMADRVSAFIPTFTHDDFCKAYEDRCSVVHGRKINDQDLNTALVYAKSLVSAALIAIIETSQAPLPDWE